MFISKHAIKKKSYFYLEHKLGSKRISVYLGKKNEIQNKIEPAFNEIIQKTIVEKLKKSKEKLKTSVLTTTEQLMLEKLKVNYGLMKKFLPQGFESFKEDEFVRYAQGSASVEGNSLSLQEALLVLEKNISIAGKKIEEIKEIENMKLAAEVSKNMQKINEKNIKKINAAILKGFDKKTPGQYRTEPIFITASEVKTVHAEKIEKEINSLTKWFEKNKKRHPLELAAEFHARFEEIHPFQDGNGRTGREILNVMLRINHYPRAIINLENRQSYTALLERVQLSKEYNKFTKFICLCLEKREIEISKIITENKKTILEKIMKKLIK